MSEIVFAVTTYFGAGVTTRLTQELWPLFIQIGVLEPEFWIFEESDKFVQFSFSCLIGPYIFTIVSDKSRPTAPNTVSHDIGSCP